MGGVFSRVNIFAPSKGMQISAAAASGQLRARKLMWFQTRFSKHRRRERERERSDIRHRRRRRRRRRRIVVCLGTRSSKESLKNIPRIAFLSLLPSKPRGRGRRSRSHFFHSLLSPSNVVRGEWRVRVECGTRLARLSLSLTSSSAQSMWSVKITRQKELRWNWERRASRVATKKRSFGNWMSLVS